MSRVLMVCSLFLSVVRFHCDTEEVSRLPLWQWKLYVIVVVFGWRSKVAELGRAPKLQYFGYIL